MSVYCIPSTTLNVFTYCPISSTFLYSRPAAVGFIVSLFKECFADYCVLYILRLSSFFKWLPVHPCFVQEYTIFKPTLPPGLCSGYDYHLYMEMKKLELRETGHSDISRESSSSSTCVSTHADLHGS